MTGKRKSERKRQAREEEDEIELNWMEREEKKRIEENQIEKEREGKNLRKLSRAGKGGLRRVVEDGLGQEIKKEDEKYQDEKEWEGEAREQKFSRGQFCSELP